jgi:hypothetical protein
MRALCSQTMNEKQQKHLGTPHIELMGLQIWIHGRQFPDSEDYWDGNWLHTTAHCSAEGASIWASGSKIHLSEILHWQESTENLYDSLQGEAKLDCMEPELKVSIEAESQGHLKFIVEITPNHIEQLHSFSFELDQSYLPKLVNSCKEILKAYPIRNPVESTRTKRMQSDAAEPRR